MTVDPLKILSRRIQITTLLFSALLALYIGFSLFLFFQWVGPSLDGRSDQRIAADSSGYMQFAEELRSGNPDPFVIVSLSSFPNTLWVPVLIAFALKSTFAIVIANYAMFFLALYLLRKVFTFSAGIFVGLLLLNATTTVSLLSVNKEIVDLLVVSLFFFAYRKHHNYLLVIALLLALLNRFEVCMVMIVFLFVKSRLNFVRRRRVLTLASLSLLMSIALPLLAAKALNAHFEEASGGHAVVLLDSLEMHYMYGIAVVPKIAENLFGELINVSKWETGYNFSDLANSYILLSNNFASAIVFLYLIIKRTFTTRSDVVYFSLLGCIIMAMALVIQPRYFYFVYVLLCLQAAHPSDHRRVAFLSMNHRQEVTHA